MNWNTIKNIISAGRAPAIALAALSIAIPGCANYDSTEDASVNQCTDAADHSIKVIFEDRGDGKGLCPVDVDVAPASRCTAADQRCVRVSHKQPRIRWYSEPKGIKFGVFFDPLMGPQNISNPRGCLRKKINTEAPPATDTAPVEYKYAVAKMGTGKKLDPLCDALDPRVIIDH